MERIRYEILSRENAELKGAFDAQFKSMTSLAEEKEEQREEVLSRSLTRQIWEYRELKGNDLEGSIFKEEEMKPLKKEIENYLKQA